MGGGRKHRRERYAIAAAVGMTESGIHYFYGEDTYRARQAIDDLALEHKARVRWLDQVDFEEKTPGELLGRGSRGLFGQELLVIRDVYDMPVSLQSDIAAALGRGSALCVLWDRAKSDKRSATCKKNQERGRVFDLPQPTEAAKWLMAQAEQRGGRLDEAAARMMVERLGVDSWRLITELEKILVTQEHVTVDYVAAAVLQGPSAEMFAMLEALTRGDLGRAVTSVEILLGEGNGEFYILSMLAYQFRTLLAIRRGIDQGRGQAEMAGACGLKPYSVQKNYSHARRFSENYLRNALTRILATDFSIRQGKVDQRTGLMMLVLGLVKR